MAYTAKQTRQFYKGWDEFYAKPEDEKLEFFKQGDRLFDVIFAQQFDRTFLDFICRLSDMVKPRM